ncbi:MAG TPA: 50S ribosomal protein L29 [bacterium]|jgi:large subunit ribosomal protein L29|nr:50S ribosomal protein L29 [bacterium]MDX9805552.1 50S ribosomal protein L29 [bacterium]HNW15778.1 50S ribosomal protein L29 [bacterium]HNZ53395.1 50S ribosomal protein L29 [bacterium]HOG44006.1 50S ribosomal protein L29 [bacterium]
MKVSELREKTLAELQEKLLSYKEEQFNLRMQKGMGQMENNSRAVSIKKDIARIKTMITEKKKAVEVKK